MKWDSSLGPIPDNFDTIMLLYYESFKNSKPEFSHVTYTKFTASREYELFYPSVQIDMQIEALISEIYTKTTEFIAEKNLAIQNPTTTRNAIASALEREFGLKASVKEMIEEDSGKIHLAIDYTPEPALNLQIASYLEAKGVVASAYMVGDIEQPIVLTSGGVATYRWVTADEGEIKFKMTITESRVSTAPTDSVDEVVAKFTANWNAIYKIGQDIEPEVYFEIVRDAPYASNILTEYSTDGGTSWSSAPLVVAYDKKFNMTLKSSDVIIEGR